MKKVQIFILVLIMSLQFSCSKEDSKTMPQIEEQEEIEVVLLEFASNFTPNSKISLLPTAELNWGLTNANESETISFNLKFGTNKTSLNVISTDNTDTSFQLQELLDPETTYYWQVSFVNRNGMITESEIHEFNTSKIVFEDASLEQIVRDILNKPEGDFAKDELSAIVNIPFDLTVTDWEALTIYESISSLSGLEYCTNLERVNLFQTGFRNPLTNLTPLANLPVKYLSLANNQISDLSVVENFSDLEYLHLGWNIGVSDITPLENLNKLKTLDLTYTHSLRDISPLRNLTQLDSLSYSHAYYIQDISPIGDLVNLKKLRFTGSEIITDFEFLTNLTVMEKLYLDRNVHLDNLSFVSNMPNLKELNISTTGITDISMLSNFSNMEFLSLRGLEISDFSVLSNMPNLRELHYDDYDIDDTILSRQDIWEMFPGIKMIINGSVYNDN